MALKVPRGARIGLGVITVTMFGAVGAMFLSAGRPLVGTVLLALAALRFWALLVDIRARRDERARDEG